MPELRRRDVAILKRRIAQHRLHRLGQPVAARRARVDRRAWRADDRELRRDEDAVQQDERGDDEERRHARPSFVAWRQDDRRRDHVALDRFDHISTPLTLTCSPAAGTPPSVRVMNDADRVAGTLPVGAEHLRAPDPHASRPGA